MSFHWNLSSDEEEDDDVVEGGVLSITTDSTRLTPAFSRLATAGNEKDGVHEPKGFSFGDFDQEEEDEEEEEEIDWEDADDTLDDVDDGALKPAANNNINNITTPLQPVTIDLDAIPTTNDNTEESKKRKRVKRRKVYRFQSLPQDMQSFLQNLHRAHLLALTSHALFLSRLSSHSEVMHVSHSLIPSSWVDTTVTKECCKGDEKVDADCPTQPVLAAFCTWFFDLVNHTEERRQQRRAANFAAGAPNRASHRGRRSNYTTKHNTHSPNRQQQPMSQQANSQLCTPQRLLRYCTYLSPAYDEDPQLYEDEDDQPNHTWSSQDKALLLISMCRSIGWRTRYAIIADPIRCDLDEDHPILNNDVFNIFQSNTSSAKDGKPRAKRTKRSINQDADPTEGIASQPTLGWVEILCRVNPNGQGDRKLNLRWVHVDPGRELTDQPNRVCMIYGAAKEGDSRSIKKKAVIPYAVAAEHRSVVSYDADTEVDEDQLLLGHIVDVTPRYSLSWTESLRARGVRLVNGAAKTGQPQFDTWWTKSLSSVNQVFRSRVKQMYQQMQRSIPSVGDTSHSTAKVSPHRSAPVDSQDGSNYTINVDDDHDEVEVLEKEEFQKSVRQEPLPTSKAAFKSHPLYAIKSVLTTRQVLAPDAPKRIVGVFKGELVYHRSDVSTALSAKKWLYQGRKVTDSELPNPIMNVKPRLKPTPKGFQPLKSYGVGASNDGSEAARARELEAASKPLDDEQSEALYAVWQTIPWSPDPVDPDDDIPINEFKNVELELINPGLVHVDEPRVARVAKQLGIPYAPCLIGFEGQGSNRVPVVRGVVIHEQNEQLLREAHLEVSSHALEQEHKKRRDAIYLRWKRLIIGVLTKQRLERDYKDDEQED